MKPVDFQLPLLITRGYLTFVVPQSPIVSAGLAPQHHVLETADGLLVEMVRGRGNVDRQSKQGNY